MESIIKETELKYEKDALIDSNRGGNHTNRDALIQGIKYISRTRKNEDRANEHRENSFIISKVWLY